MNKTPSKNLSVLEKIGYSLGDGAANIAWRGVSTFLFIFYTDVYGLNPAAVGLLFFVARFSDGISDIAMGIVGDRTKTRWGKFRPWILWTAIPLAAILSLLFTAPDLSNSGKIVYAYLTYIIFTLVYTANNIPYGALMAVMTGDDKERASIGSYRMVGAFVGGMVVQGALLFLVASFGGIKADIEVNKIQNNVYEVGIKSTEYVENANVKTDLGGSVLDVFSAFFSEDEEIEDAGFGNWLWKNEKDSADAKKAVRHVDIFPQNTYLFVALGEDPIHKNDITLSNTKAHVEISKLESEEGYLLLLSGNDRDSLWNVALSSTNENIVFKYLPNASPSISFELQKGERYRFIVSGITDLNSQNITLINQSKGYSYAIYLMSVALAILLLITFYSTRERIEPPKQQKSDLKQDLKDLFRNQPWIVLLIIGLLFNVYNNIKQGIVVIYFTHYLHNQLLSASFMIGLMLASIAGAMITAPLSKKLGKKHLFIYALLFSGGVNALLYLCGPHDIAAIFGLGLVSEFGAAIFPTLFFAMLGDAADYSEYKNGRRATGLIYSAGSFATKFGGGIAGAIIGFILGAYHYNGLNPSTIEGAIPGIKMLMSWVPSVIAILAAILMNAYPLNQKKLDTITHELSERRKKI